MQKSFSLNRIVSASFFVLGALIVWGFPGEARAAYPQFEPGAEVTIGEFVYDDDFVATTTDNCSVSVYNPSGTLVVDAQDLTAEASGWHHYSFTPASTEGTWPAFISCGTALAGDLVKGDKTFVITSNIVSSSSVAELVNANTNAVVTAASSSLGTTLSSIISSFLTIPAEVWSYGTKTLSSFGSLAADVWSAGTRTLTGASLSSGSLATQSDIETASSSLAAVVNANTNSATAGITSAVNANTDAVVATASSSVAATVNSNTNSIVTAASSSLGSVLSSVASSISGIPAAVWASGTRSLTTFGSLAVDVWSSATRTLTGASLDAGSLATQSDVQTASSSVVAGINSNTNTQTAALTTTVTNASTSVAASVNSNTNSAIATASSSVAAVVNANTNSIVLAASSSLGSTLSSVVSSIAGIPAAVWASGARTLTSLGSLATDVWSAGTRTLTGASLDTGSLATLSDVQTASSSLAAVVNANTNSIVGTASSSIGAAISNISASSGGWSVSMSDFSSVLAGGTYRARITTVNASTVSTPNATPTITVYDADRNTVVSSVAMTALSTGVYEYTYSVSSGGAEGVWESVVSTEVESGRTIVTNDYWDVTTAPAQVLVQSMGLTETPSITANIRITNEGSIAYEYQYEWCVVSSINNACGGGNDTYYASAAKLIQPGADFDTTLTATVPLAGTYYFKTVAYFGTDSSGASRQFVATAPAGSGGESGGSSGGGGGGGGGGSSSNSDDDDDTVVTSTTPADINGDNKVNGTDFSILLAFWKTTGPLTNAAVDLNHDSKVDSVDFSILLYRWSK